MRAGSLFPFLNEVDCLAWDSSVCYNFFILINTLYLTYYWTWTHVMLLNKGLWSEYKFLWYELCVWVMQMCRPVLPELHSSTTSSSSGSMSRQASLWWYSVFNHTERRSFTGDLIWFLKNWFSVTWSVFPVCQDWMKVHLMKSSWGELLAAVHLCTLDIPLINTDT